MALAGRRLSPSSSLSRRGGSGDQLGWRHQHRLGEPPVGSAAGQPGHTALPSELQPSRWSLFCPGSRHSHMILTPANSQSGGFLPFNLIILILKLFQHPLSQQCPRTELAAQTAVHTALVAKIKIIFIIFTGNISYAGCCLTKKGKR